MSIHCHFWPSDTEDFWTHYSQIGTIRRKAGKEKQHLKEGRKKKRKKTWFLIMLLLNSGMALFFKSIFKIFV